MGNQAPLLLKSASELAKNLIRDELFIFAYVQFYCVKMLSPGIVFLSMVFWNGQPNYDSKLEKI